MFHFLPIGIFLWKKVLLENFQPTLILTLAAQLHLLINRKGLTTQRFQIQSLPQDTNRPVLPGLFSGSKSQATRLSKTINKQTNDKQTRPNTQLTKSLYFQAQDLLLLLLPKFHCLPLLFACSGV